LKRRTATSKRRKKSRESILKRKGREFRVIQQTMADTKESDGEYEEADLIENPGDRFMTAVKMS